MFFFYFFVFIYLFLYNILGWCNLMNQTFSWNLSFLPLLFVNSPYYLLIIGLVNGKQFKALLWKQVKPKLVEKIIIILNQSSSLAATHISILFFSSFAFPPFLPLKFRLITQDIYIAFIKMIIVSHLSTSRFVSRLSIYLFKYSSNKLNNHP